MSDWWTVAPPESFTARCWREWEIRMRFDQRFGQPAVGKYAVDVISTEDRRQQSACWPEKDDELTRVDRPS